MNEPEKNHESGKNSWKWKKLKKVRKFMKVGKIHELFYFLFIFIFSFFLLTLTKSQMGADSLSTVQLINIIKKNFGKEISISMLEEKGTFSVEDLAEFLVSSGELGDHVQGKEEKNE